ncbi:MAG: DUF1405 domain-containing protein [Methanocellales archaeon]
MMKLWEKLVSGKALSIIAIINAGGTAFGFYYYRHQLAGSSPWLWIFIPDCPLYTLFFLIWYLLTSIKRESHLFSLLTAAGLMKYGFWTTLVVALYRDYFLSYNYPLYATLFLLHIGMALESILILPSVETRKMQVLAVLLWFLLNDYADYYLNTYPYIPTSFLDLIKNITIASTFGSIAIAVLLAKKLAHLRAY